jgi:hypothetical protein
MAHQRGAFKVDHGLFGGDAGNWVEKVDEVWRPKNSRLPKFWANNRRRRQEWL